MRKRIWHLGAVFWLLGVVGVPCTAMVIRPSRATVEAEARSIEAMAAAGDVDGLVRMLSEGAFPSKVAAAKELGEVGDERGLPELKELNASYGGWTLGSIHHDRSGAFAVAICKIQTRNQPEEARIEALLDLVDGKGAAVPESLEPPKSRIKGVLREWPLRLDRNLWVGRSVGVELDRFDDPSVTARIRRSENQGISPYAVWREVRDMDVEAAILRCRQIAQDEGGAQRYGAIHCLERFGAESVETLSQLAEEGHGEAIVVLSRWEEAPEIFELLCRHATSTKNFRGRWEAVRVVSSVKDPSLRVRSLTVLVQALYDPSEAIRRKAATTLLDRAGRYERPYFDRIEDSLRIALNHPDPEVSSRVRQGLTRLGYERLNDVTEDPPAIRTDLEARSPSPPTAEQRLKARIAPLEKDAAQCLRNGPAERAVALYEELLEIKPGYEPYREALATARAYVQAAAETSEPWYPDAPYIGLKGRYSYLLASKTMDSCAMGEAYKLAQMLESRPYAGWTTARRGVDDPKGQDQYFKALELYRHIVARCPANELTVYWSTQRIHILMWDLTLDGRYHILGRIEMFATSVGDMVDSVSGADVRRVFEQFKTDERREQLIQSCTRDGSVYDLLDVITERCAVTDPKIVEMARAAKIRVGSP